MADVNRGNRPLSPCMLGKYYKYRVRVYCPWTRRVETVESTDPYSRSLAANGERTHVCDTFARRLDMTVEEHGCRAEPRAMRRRHRGERNGADPARRPPHRLRNG